MVTKLTSLCGKFAFVCGFLAPYLSGVLAAGQFNDRNNFEGWNCGKITSCGHYGRICGGYNAKGKGSDIQKTFQLPTGTYVVMMDFIKIDSWFVKQVGLVALLFSFHTAALII